jgi:signal transduction histidine kinase
MSSSWIKSKVRAFGLRLNLWFGGMLVALCVFIFLTGYLLLSQAVAAGDREIILAQVDVYQTWYQQGGTNALSEHFAQRNDSGKESFFVRVVGAQNAALFMSLPAQSKQFDLSALNNVELKKTPSWMTLPAQDRTASWLIATTRLSDGSLLQVGKTTEAQTALLEHFQLVSAWVAILAIVLGVGGGAWLTHQALAPIHRLVTALRQVIATGKFDQRVPPRASNDELAQLAALFNQMLDKNAALIRGMREALDNVAHDLRTPLARLRATAENALQSADDVTVLREALSDSLEESDRVLTIMTTLMDISEAEVGLMKLEQTAVNLSDLIAASVALYQFVAEDKGIEVTMSVPPDLTCPGDPNRLRQVVVNLIDNALKYTPPGGKVSVCAEARNNDVLIRVQDNGMGISADDLPRIWDRLYRSDKSRSQRGLGLGLSLVKAVTEAHRGRVAVTSEVAGGSTFEVWLPADAPAWSGTLTAKS